MLHSLLGELDDELMLELDEIVRQNQLACLPMSKSGRAEAELIETYPRLTDLIERGKRIKIDSVSLQTRLHEREAKSVGGSKAKAAFLEDFEQSPSVQKSRPRPSQEPDSQLKSPGLKPKRSAADLIFDMEEDVESDAEDDISAPGRRRRPALTADSSFPRSGMSPRTDGRGDVEFTSLKDDDNIAALTTPVSHQTAGVDIAHSPIPFRSRKPWSTPTLPPSKIEMKDIMAQDSSSHVSYISAGLSPLGKQGGPSSAGLPAKLSQRERKKQQQQQALSPKPVPASSPAAAEVSMQAQPTTSPWQVASKGPKVSLMEIIGGSSNSPPQPGSVARTPSPMTLRQTIAGKAPSARKAVTGPAQSPLPTQKRSVSTPDVPHSTSHARSPPSRSSSSQIPIQSIRHTSPSAEPTLQLSMADILSQQQTEKEIIKEAAAKRSLQEIQEEQAFQEWWDEESRKVKAVEEEATAAKPAARGGKGMRSKGRGGSRGRGRGKDGGKGEVNGDGSPGGTNSAGGGRGGQKGASTGPRGRGR